MSTTRASILLAGLLVGLAPGLRGQGGSLQMLLGFAGDNKTNKNVSVPIAGIYDLNNDNKVDPQTAELFAFLRKWHSNNKGNGSFIYDIQHVVEEGDISFYVADAGDGWIVKCVDANANGIMEDAEATKWAKLGSLTQQGTFGPNTVAVRPGAKRPIVYLGANTSTSRPFGIFRCEDKNDDGDALDTGENTLLVSVASNLTFPHKATGTVPLKIDNWDRVRTITAPTRKVDLVAWNSTTRNAPKPQADTFCYFGFNESGGTLSKHSVFFNPSKLNQLVENADIASGALEDQDIVVGTAGDRFNGYSFCEVDQNGHLGAFPAYYFANSYGKTRSYGSKNAAGNLLHGVILRGIDLNNDGDLQDKGEVNVFFNGSGNDLKGGAVGTVKTTTWKEPGTGRGTVTEIAGFATGLAEGEGVVYLLIENGRNDYVLELRDRNKNGYIDPTGEVIEYYATPSSPYPAIFSQQYGPYSLELHAIDRSLVVDPLPAGIEVFGQGCIGSNGLVPRMSETGGVPTVGNGGVRLEMVRGMPGKPSIYFLGISNKAWGAIPLPLALAGLGMPGCSQLVSLELVTVALNNAGGGSFIAFPIPNAAPLKGLVLYFQCWSQDPSANANQWVTSNGMKLTIQ